MSIVKVSEPISGDKLYQERAREALPLLVRQAQAGEPIRYSDLAEELGMPNPRNLNYVLGSIGKSMELLSKAWKEKVPPIQCLVINKATGLPGEGIGWFLVKEEVFSELPLKQKRAIVDAELQHVYAYRKWLEVLKALALKPTKTDFTTLVSKASHWAGGGEGERHKVLKEFVARHPESIGLKSGTPTGAIEHPLPSGDFLDVSFLHKKVWVAAEVKSAISPESDLIRGLFQCVKYRAVMEAVQISEAHPQNARALLVLEASLPPSLVALKNLLGVEVIERVSPENG